MGGRSRQHAIFAWAWPHEPIDRLLQAAAHAQDDAARQAWRRWAHGKDLDDVQHNEMRLLAAVAPRLAKLDPTHEERNRIVGIERMLWSRSLVLLRHMQPAFESLHQAGIEIMILKGAARVARDPKALRLRFVNDVDILVRPADFRAAFDLLDAAGWRGTGTGTANFHRAQLDYLHGVNLIHGEIADLDLHRSAFHEPHLSLDDDAQMWDRSTQGALAGCPARVPSATDTIVMAVAHGGEGGHRTSDWLLDIIDAVGSGTVDWDLLQGILERRRLLVPAAVSLTYLADQLQCPIPSDALESIVSQARRSRISLALGLLLSHPKDSFSTPMKLARITAKAWHTRNRNKVPAAEPVGVTRRARIVWSAASAEPTAEIYHTTIRVPDRGAGDAWQGVVEAIITLPELKRARRIEFELSAGPRHVARVKYRKWTSRSRRVTLRFRAPVELAAGEDELRLEAAPGRGLRTTAPAKLAERYGPVPFRVVAIRCHRAAA
jgi:hypothetical protein